MNADIEVAKSHMLRSAPCGVVQIFKGMGNDLNVSIVQIQALNDLYRRADGREGLGFGKRTISGGGTWLAAGDEDGQAARKTKKNMATVTCKACGQVMDLPEEVWIQ